MKVERLSAEDRLMLDASRRWPQDIGALVMLDGTPLLDGRGGFRLAAVRDLIASRLHLVPRFRQVVRSGGRGRGGPYWADARSFDLAGHVRELPLEQPAGTAELLGAVERLRGERIDPRQPLWQFWFITGRSDHRVALFVKIHHAVADGLAAMTIVSAFLDDVAEVPVGAAPAWSPRIVRSSDLVGENLSARLSGLLHAIVSMARPSRSIRSLLALGPAVRELLGEPPGDSTSIERMVGESRSIALVRTEFRTARRISRACGATLNDLLLALTSAGMRALLDARHEPVAGVVLRAYVPVTLRRHLHGTQQGSEIAQMAVPLSMDADSPVLRLRAISAETRRRKARPRPKLGKLFRGRLTTKLLLKLVMAQHVNITTASIPGPRRPMYLAGAQLLEVFPVLPLLGNQSIGIGVVSYADTFNIGITADRDTFPDLPLLADAMRAELRALAEATRSVLEAEPLTASV